MKIWMACVVLWERLAPGVVNSEQIDDLMQEGYDFADQGKPEEACSRWLEVWRHLKDRFFFKDMKSIKDADRIFSGMQFLSNWCQDFKNALTIAAEEDPSFHQKRFRYCSEFCDYFPQSESLTMKNMRSAMEESGQAMKGSSFISPVDSTDVQDLLRLLEFNDGKFPREALQKAMGLREAITPALLEIIRQAKSNAGKLLKQGTYFAHIFAMFLLAFFREKEAYPLMVDFFMLRGIFHWNSLVILLQKTSDESWLP